ncbi:MAG: DegT/DnrJ/EryC1/StrS family aminotransferase [Weeksellaceae bacterium]
MNVTKTFLPPMEEYIHYFQRAYDKVWLTNRGELVKELEDKLKLYLDVDYLTLTTNGTLPLQIAIKALELKGEIITTPFSYVATTTAIVWEHCTPIFVDIEPDYLTIDPSKIEAAISENTSAILATHVFGNPCDVEAIEKIAKKHNLKVIYDAAHCFGVRYKGESVFNYGDVSTCSFHATKIFHTGEGGCFITKDEALHHKLYYHHNFGHKTATSFYGVGTNAKMSELQAAMGLAVFDHIDEIIEKRKMVVESYNEHLTHQKLQLLKIRENTEWNYHYYPVIFESEETLLQVEASLNQKNIFPRRYFYPSLNTLDYVDNNIIPISESIAKRILCLPLSTEMNETQVKQITKILLENLT